MEHHTVHSMAEYVSCALDITSRWIPGDANATLWYRGVKSDTFDLIPGAYLRKPCDEITLTLYFRQLTPGLLDREPSDDWEWYYAMQHYGLPTRLLDWSESALSALYFALEEDDAANPTVWVLHPLALNRLAGWEYLIHPKPGTDLDYWLTERCGRHTKPHNFAAGERFANNAKALAIYPKRYNPRIVAQRGVFTVHGFDETPLNHLAITDASGNDRLAKIVIPSGQRALMRSQLYMLGFDKAAIYPEPQSVAQDLKRALGLK